LVVATIFWLTTIFFGCGNYVLAVLTMLVWLWQPYYVFGSQISSSDKLWVATAKTLAITTTKKKYEKNS